MTLTWEKTGIKVWVNDGTDREPPDSENYISWRNERRSGLISKSVISLKEAESYILHALLAYHERVGTLEFALQGSLVN